MDIEELIKSNHHPDFLNLLTEKNMQAVSQKEDCNTVLMVEVLYNNCIHILKQLEPVLSEKNPEATFLQGIKNLCQAYETFRLEKGC